MNCDARGRAEHTTSKTQGPIRERRVSNPSDRRGLKRVRWLWGNGVLLRLGLPNISEAVLRITMSSN
jgi:hypothetical protein